MHAPECFAHSSDWNPQIWSSTNSTGYTVLQIMYVICPSAELLPEHDGVYSITEYVLVKILLVNY